LPAKYRHLQEPWCLTTEDLSPVPRWHGVTPLTPAHCALPGVPASMCVESRVPPRGQRSLCWFKISRRPPWGHSRWLRERPGGSSRVDRGARSTLEGASGPYPRGPSRARSRGARWRPARRARPGAATETAAWWARGRREGAVMWHSGRAARAALRCAVRLRAQGGRPERGRSGVGLQWAAPETGERIPLQEERQINATAGPLGRGVPPSPEGDLPSSCSRV
jgi:hypothetical protein